MFIMNIQDIINEETQHLMREIVTGGDSRIPTYSYQQASEGRFVIDVDEPQKNIRANFDVSFSPEGNRDEKAYSIAFKPSGGNYSDKTGMGVQFRLLATITKIIKEQVAVHNPNILTFQPVKEHNESGNRRLSLYMQYVKGGAGEDFDAFIIGGDRKVNVEKRNPSFPIENGYQDPETIQDILTQLSVYGGYYQTDLYPNDPDYEKFSMTSWGGFHAESNRNGRRGTVSARRFVDWMFSAEDLSYVQGQHEPEPYQVPREPTTTGVDAPIQRVGGDSHTATAMVGTFQYFLQTQVYGNPEYEILEPFFETVKSIGDFNELRSRASHGLSAARSSADTERLTEIIRAIDQLKREHQDYAERYGTSAVDENQILNEVEEYLLELLSE
jgi:hypothetical protein